LKRPAIEIRKSIRLLGSHPEGGKFCLYKLGMTNNDGGNKFMGLENQKIINALSASIKELQQGIDTHCCLVASLMKDGVDERNLKPLLELCPERTREVRLKSAIKEAIDVIEESRKAFKSKKLEALRKKLTQVLIDVN
jgi:hypothetical protein